MWDLKYLQINTEDEITCRDSASTALCEKVSPLHHEGVFLLHGEVRVDLDGVIFILQLQQFLPALLRHQLAVVDDVWQHRDTLTLISRSCLLAETFPDVTDCGTSGSASR